MNGGIDNSSSEYKSDLKAPLLNSSTPQGFSEDNMVGIEAFKSLTLRHRAQSKSIDSINKNAIKYVLMAAITQFIFVLVVSLGYHSAEYYL